MQQSPRFPPIVLFEDTNPLRRSKCKVLFHPVDSRLTAADSGPAMAGRRPVGHAYVQRLSPARSARAILADSRRYCEFNSIALGGVGTALSAADNAGLRRACRGRSSDQGAFEVPLKFRQTNPVLSLAILQYIPTELS